MRPDDEAGQSELFLQLQAELRSYKAALADATDRILAEEITQYPIFVIHQQEVAVGIPIIDRNKVAGNWSVNVSTLEQFADKKLILPDKLEEFKRVYKDPDDFLCLFVLSELGAVFIFLPRE